ncbi:hypothetical protein A3K88_13955 [Pseudomonas putida]|nr:hypothetical protein A3K88_13955 [Pseudomonas putida]
MTPFRALLIVLAIVTGVIACNAYTTKRAPVDAVGDCDSITDPEKRQECREQKINDLVSPTAAKPAPGVQ